MTVDTFVCPRKMEKNAGALRTIILLALTTAEVEFWLTNHLTSARLPFWDLETGKQL